MVTSKKQASKPTKSVKPAANAKKATPVKKPVANKNVKAPVKKTPAKPVAKKAAPAKKAIPVKKTPAKPIAKAAPAKKPAAIKKQEKNNNQKTVNKKNIKPTPIAKKAAPAKKKEAPKKAAPAKKATTIVKKAIVAKPAPKAPAKPIAKAPIAKELSAPKKAAATPPPPPVKVTGKAKKAPPKKTLTGNQIPVKAGPPAPRPMATPAARPTEKKPNVIIAHRRLENKSKAPKGHANTMTQYQPETYRSILDEPQQIQGPVYRYSDEDLNEFRDIITSRLDAARKELNYLQGLITRKDEAGTEDTENRYMNMEDGSGAMEREQLAQLASRQIQFMGHLEKALVRIENKTYGICRVTGKLIDKARLRAVPHATLSIEAKKLLATKQN